MEIDPDEMKRRSRGDSADMSPRAIEQRLRIVGELYRMWQTLRHARRVGPVEPSASVDNARDPPR